MRILIVEDDQILAGTLKQHLSKDYVIHVVGTMKAAQQSLITHEFDLVLVDHYLPDGSGLYLCQQLRVHKQTIPILMMTIELSLNLKLEAFDTGIDDYLIKPFALPELMARIRALLRRPATQPMPTIFEVKDLYVHTGTKTVTRDGRVIQLRRKEFDILEYLLQNAGRVVTRKMILDHAWKNADGLSPSVVDVHIKYLRDKVDRPFTHKLIKTVRYLGYKLIWR